MSSQFRDDLKERRKVSQKKVKVERARIRTHQCQHTPSITGDAVILCYRSSGTTTLKNIEVEVLGDTEGLRLKTCVKLGGVIMKEGEIEFKPGVTKVPYMELKKGERIEIRSMGIPIITLTDVTVDFLVEVR